MKTLLAAIAAIALSAPTAFADARPDSHAPIGVMGDHLHKSGEWMFSYRFMQMSMEGNRDGSTDLDPETIATSVSNRFANPPMMPPTLRVVPTKMTMDMHMLGLMYAPSDNVTLMAMTNYVRKDMDHVTFAGPAGSNRLGTFSTSTSGFGDTRLAALVHIAASGDHLVHATLGLSVPTGSTDETGTILTPMNMTPTPRLPYPMQLGSGTYDVIAGLTYSGHGDRWAWGSQWQSDIRTGENDDQYTLGDEHRLSGWLSYRIRSDISLSGRVSYLDRGNIDGMDPLIMAPVQTADPDRQGAERIDLSAGLNMVMPGDRHRLALEFSVPVSQKLDGPQLETDWQLMVGWQFAP